MLAPLALVGVAVVGAGAAWVLPGLGLLEHARAQGQSPPPAVPAGTPGVSSGATAITGAFANGQSATSRPGTDLPPTNSTVTNPAGTTPLTVGATEAISVLLEQANYWLNQQQYPQALQSLDRALRIAPTNADALALSGQVQADRGNRPAAENALARLRLVSPGDPRIEKIDQALRVGPIPQEALSDARKLAHDGRTPEAIDRYNRVFRGNPPPDALAVEYYQTLSGTEGGWEQARDGLARLVRQNPQDLRAQLAYAQILSYREGTRADGVARLQALAQNPAVADTATQSWKQALNWLPDSKTSVPPLNSYLEVHPNDPQVQGKLQSAEAPPPAADQPTLDRTGGFEALNSGKLKDAARLFQSAIDVNANDADALGGLGIVKLRQRNLADAKGYLGRAIALDPENKGRWQRAYDAAAHPYVGKPTGRGGPGPSPQSLAQTRAAQLRAQAANIADPIQREATLRVALDGDPTNVWTRLDLARTLVRENRLNEARGLMAQAVSGRAGTDALKAGVIFANETHDPDAATILIARLPPNQRTPYMNSAIGQAQLQRDIARALEAGGDDRREALLRLAAKPDPDGARGAAIARAFNQLSDSAGAREAIAAAQAATRNQTASQDIAYAGAFTEIGDVPAARAMMRRAQGAGSLTPSDREGLASLQTGIAIRSSDSLNEKGRQADAYDRLAPELARRPDDPPLNEALARLYQSANKPRQALSINETLLQRDPANGDARRGAIAAAIAMDQNNRADRLAREGLQLSPNDPRMWLSSADVAKATGNNLRALRDLERARELRLQQIGYTDNGEDDSTLPGVSLTPGDTPNYQPIAIRPRWTRAEAGEGAGMVLAQNDVTPGLLDRGRLDVPPNLYPPAAPQPASGTPPGLSSANQIDQQPLAPPRRDPLLPHPLLDTAPTALPAPSQPMPQYLPAPSQRVQAAPPPSPMPQRLPPAPSYAAPTYAEPAASSDTGPFGSTPVSSQAQSRVAEGYGNPFRSGVANSVLGVAGSSGESIAAPADPMTAQIDRDIAVIRDQVSPTAQGAIGFRTRSGDSGIDGLTELTVPLEATFSPGGRGTLKIAATPTVLTSGSIGGDSNNLQRFGAQALLIGPPPQGSFTNTYSGTGVKDQHAEGLGLDLGYAVGSVSADIGSTPLGFRENNVVGGVEWAPLIANRTRLRLIAEQRAVTDSILSYAGTRDDSIGRSWGGVTRKRGNATLEASVGVLDLYVGGGYGQLDGQHVKTNTEVEAGAGGSFPIYKTADQEVRVGLDLVYFGYDRNLRFFTYGQGGYFSPQTYVAALLPVTYKEQVDEDLRYEVGATVGVQSYHENQSPYFPLDPNLQAQLVAKQAAGAIPGLNTSYPSRSESGFAGGAHALVDYTVTPSLHVGAKANYLRAGNFSEGSGLVYARYIFNGADANGSSPTAYGKRPGVGPDQ